MFAISETPIDTVRLKRHMQDPASGACVVFEGWARDHNEGKQVQRLEYEAYEALCLSEGQRILDEAIMRFKLNAAGCVHRTGSLEIGDCAVWVGVSSAHRGEAFEACRYIIDEIKGRVPIWKKEHYTDGDSGWVNCAHCAAAHPHEH
jgi:molybdopterin synthase catalytic subunit